MRPVSAEPSPSTLLGSARPFGLGISPQLLDSPNSLFPCSYYAQLAAQPLAAYLLVKVKTRQFMPIIVLCVSWLLYLAGLPYLAELSLTSQNCHSPRSHTVGNLALWNGRLQQLQVARSDEVPTWLV